jgi:hypothetical protein
MMRRTLADWQRLIEQQQKSGQPIAVFCKQKNLPTSNFYKYRNKLKLGKSSEAFVKAQVIKSKPTKASVMPLTYGETRLTILDNCSPNWLAQLIKALHA